MDITTIGIDLAKQVFQVHGIDAGGGVVVRNGRMRKVMVVALARKLLIALWRFAMQGLVPGGAV